MASASSTSARSLFSDSKMRLADRVQVNINNISSLARQITRGSKSNEVKQYQLNNNVNQADYVSDIDAFSQKLCSPRTIDGEYRK